MKSPVPTERQVQRDIVQGLRAIGLSVVHVPNGGQYRGTTAERAAYAMSKRMDGQVSGFPDLLVLSKRLDPGRVVFLEVKRPGVSLATDTARRQLECHDAMTADHHKVAVVSSFDQALDRLREWGMVA